MFITAVCVIFLIKLRWPKNKSLKIFILNFNHLRESSNKGQYCFHAEKPVPFLSFNQVRVV